MTGRVLRQVTDLIRDAGGSAVEVRTGGKHRKVYFRDPSGAERWITVHTGSYPKRYEDCLRSQLRRRGLNL